MAGKFGPSRGEVLFRLWFSLAGLLVLVAVVFVNGWPSGPAGVETIGIASLFFGGTAIWACRTLWLRRKEDGQAR